MSEVRDDGPFFHGTKADLRVGDHDPNVTDKKFPGNPTRSYRSSDPLLVIGEVDNWTRQTPEALAVWHDRLAALRTSERGEIIN